MVSRGVLFPRLSTSGLSSRHDWFRGYLGNRQSVVRIFRTLSFSFLMMTGVLQDSVLGPSIFSVFINDIRTSVHNYKYRLFSDDLS